MNPTWRSAGAFDNATVLRPREFHRVTRTIQSYKPAIEKAITPGGLVRALTGLPPVFMLSVAGMEKNTRSGRKRWQDVRWNETKSRPERMGSSANGTGPRFRFRWILLAALLAGVAGAGIFIVSDNTKQLPRVHRH